MAIVGRCGCARRGCVVPPRRNRVDDGALDGGQCVVEATHSHHPGWTAHTADVAGPRRPQLDDVHQAMQTVGQIPVENRDATKSSRDRRGRDRLERDGVWDDAAGRRDGGGDEVEVVDKNRYPLHHGLGPVLVHHPQRLELGVELCDSRACPENVAIKRKLGPVVLPSCGAGWDGGGNCQRCLEGSQIRVESAGGGRESVSYFGELGRDESANMTQTRQTVDPAGRLDSVSSFLNALQQPLQTPSCPSTEREQKTTTMMQRVVGRCGDGEETTRQLLERGGCFRFQIVGGVDTTSDVRLEERSETSADVGHPIQHCSGDGTGTKILKMGLINGGHGHRVGRRKGGEGGEGGEHVSNLFPARSNEGRHDLVDGGRGGGGEGKSEAPSYVVLHKPRQESAESKARRVTHTAGLFDRGERCVERREDVLCPDQRLGDLERVGNVCKLATRGERRGMVV